MLFNYNFRLICITTLISLIAFGSTANLVQNDTSSAEEIDSYYPNIDWSDNLDWQLLKAFSQEYKNVLISPISLKIVLALLYEGASGETEREFQLALQFSENKTLIREKFNRTLHALKPAERKEYLLNLGTRIFLDSSIQTQQAFAAKTKQNYDTDIVPVNFFNETDASYSINSWVDVLTNGRIRQLVRPEDVKEAVMVIANAIYFKGIWKHQFPKNRTKTSGFYLTPTKTIAVNYMTTTDKFFYTESRNLDAKILRLPYRGNRYSLFIVLPNTKGGLPDLLKKVNLQSLKTSLYQMDEVVVEVSIPKFKFNFQSRFSQFLENIGLKHMFQNTASFPGIARGPQNLSRMLFVSDIIQKSGIEIDEEGSVIYAATDVQLDNKFAEVDNVFNVTHPFLFFLEEQTNGSILFIGKVENPLETDGIPVPPHFEQVEEQPFLAAGAPQSSLGYPNLQPSPIIGQDTAISTRFNYFDLELLHEFSEINENVFISPASIKTTLAMVLEGAGGKCATEITKALRINLDRRESREQLKRLLYDLNDRGGPTVLESANSVFVSNKFKIIPNYQRTIRENYDGSVTPMDFTNPNLAAAVINGWVSNSTHGLIREIVNSGNFHADATILIANALYFKGLWKKSFNEQATQIMCFHTPRKNCANVLMMHVIDVFNYRFIPGLDAHAIELPYSDNKYAMLILLPSEKNSIQGLTRDLQHSDLSVLLNNLEETEIQLELPKFEIDYSTDLVQYLQQLKIREIFGDNANLTGIIPQENIKINNIIHKTKIQVNEKGTEAAAASGAVVIPLIGSSMPRITVNRPFLFFIYHRGSKNIIFEGQLIEPKEETANALPADSLQKKTFQINNGKTGSYNRQNPQYNQRFGGSYQIPTYSRPVDNYGQHH